MSPLAETVVNERTEGEAAFSAQDKAPVIQPTTWGGFPATGGLYTPDEVVTAKGWDIYDQIDRRDPRASRYMDFKNRALLSGGYEWVSGDDSDEGKRIAEWFGEASEKGFDGPWLDVPKRMMAGFHDGVALCEKVHRIGDDGELRGKVFLERFEDKHPRDFHFDQNIFGKLEPDGYVQFWRTGDEIRHSVRDFARYTHNQRFANLFGRSMFQPIYEAYFARQVLPRQANIGIERFGTGVLVIKVPKGTTAPEKQTILARARAMRSGSTYVIEEGEDFDTVDLSMAGFSAIKEWLGRYDREMAIGLGIPFLLFDAAETGSYALSDTQLETALILWRSLQNEIDEVITEQVGRDICAANFGPNAPCPRHKLKPVQVGGVKAIFAKYEALAKAKMRPTIELVSRELGIKEDDIEDAPVMPSPFGGEGEGGNTGPSNGTAVARDKAQFSEGTRRALTRPEMRVAFSEIEAAEESAAAKGKTLLRSIIDGEVAAFRDALARESDDGRRPLARATRTESSRGGPTRREGSGRR